MPEHIRCENLSQFWLISCICRPVGLFHILILWLAICLWKLGWRHCSNRSDLELWLRDEVQALSKELLEGSPEVYAHPSADASIKDGTVDALILLSQSLRGALYAEDVA